MNKRKNKKVQTEEKKINENDIQNYLTKSTHWGRSKIQKEATDAYVNSSAVSRTNES